MKLQLNEEQNHYPFKYGYYKHTFYALIFPIYLIGFFIVERMVPTLNEVDIILYHPIDDLIPFCEYFLIPYFLWYPFMFFPGIYLMFRDAENFKKYMIFVGVTFISSLFFFLAIKNGQDLRPVSFENDNIFIDGVKYLYTIDTNTNSCPSLHVAGSFIPVFASFKCKYMKSLWIKIFFIVGAVIISASTVFLKQHSIIDTVVGLPWVTIAFIIVYILPEKINKNK